MICFWCKAEWVGDHICQEAFEILGERGMARDPEIMSYTIAQLKTKDRDDKVH